jgi:tol-pal system protein YbgF
MRATLIPRLVWSDLEGEPNVTFPRIFGRLKRTAGYLAVVAAVLLAPAALAAGGDGQNIAQPGAVLSAFKAPVPQADIGEPARIHVAQSREAAQLAVQIQELQEQIRLLTGQVEGLQFQLTQMQTLIERMTEDNEFRFQQLEGGAGGKSNAAPQSGSVMQPEALPQDPAPTANAPDLADPAPLDQGDVVGLGEPMEDLGESADPLLGTGGLGDGTLGTLGGGRPLDLSLDGGQVSNGDADAQYAAGYDAIVRGDYAFAEDQFEQFIALYPDNPQAPDATSLLGEALIRRGAYDDAALILAEGYQKYQETPRAPDLMLRLGIALNGAGEQEVACRTFFTLEKRYTGLSAAFVQRLNDEKSKAQCPV